MIIIDDFPQRSDEWFAARLGNPGASGFDQILTNVKGEPSKSAIGYMKQLAGEKVAGKAEESYSSRWMDIGTEREAEARDHFQMWMTLEVREVALCYPDEKKKYHCSPDGLPEDESVLELKCPKLKTHVTYELSGEFPKKDYNAQVQGSLLVTGFKHAWFMSYYPGLKPFIVKVMRDDEYIDKLRVALDAFCLDLPKMIVRLKSG